MPGQNAKSGYTIVELTVTIAIIAFLAVVGGVFLIRLISIRERDREEAYVRERLSDLCGAYADDLSVGSSFSRSNRTEIVMYRHETGGVSLETGRVTRVAFLTSSTNALNRSVDLNVYSFEQGALSRTFARKVYGDATLIPLVGSNRVSLVSFKIQPLNGTIFEDGDNWTSDSALGCLEAVAQYDVKNSEGELEKKTVTVKRVVRLWNRE